MSHLQLCPRPRRHFCAVNRALKMCEGRLRKNNLGMLDLPATIASLKYLRRDLAKDIAELEAGRIRIEKTDDHADITVERLAEQKHRLGNLDQAIAVYEYS
jgi:hypothetical protein